MAGEYDFSTPGALPLGPYSPPRPANGLPLGEYDPTPQGYTTAGGAAAPSAGNLNYVSGNTIPDRVPAGNLNYVSGNTIPNRNPAAAVPARSAFVPPRAPVVNRTSIRWPKLKHVELRRPLAQYAYNDVAVGVRYIDDGAVLFAKYEVTMQQEMTRRGVNLDTASIKRHFGYEKKDELSAAVLGRNDEENNRRFRDRVDEWYKKSLIWVCVKDPATNQAVFYSHVGKQNRFHHSTFTCGGEVIGAGEWIVKGGHLKKISANSGHYRPPIEYLHRAVLLMSNAWRSDTTVLLWNVSKDDYEDVPVQEFRHRSSDGGKWKAHPGTF